MSFKNVVGVFFCQLGISEDLVERGAGWGLGHSPAQPTFFDPCVRAQPPSCLPCVFLPSFTPTPPPLPPNSSSPSPALSHHLFRRIKEFGCLRPLVLVVKYLFSQRQLNDTYTGGVGSFMLTLMALHVVQQVCRHVMTCYPYILEERSGSGRGRGGGEHTNS